MYDFVLMATVDILMFLQDSNIFYKITDGIVDITKIPDFKLVFP